MFAKEVMANDFMGSEVYTPQIGDMQIKGTAKLLNIIFVVDVSGSMRLDHRIEAVNEAFTQMIPALRQIQIDSMSEFELKISIMTFDQSARWTVAPTPIMEYNHEEIACSEWRTYFSDTYKKLGEKLTEKEYMAHKGKLAQPYIMLMTDGEPSSEDNYRPALDELLENGWFMASQRFAVLIGSDAINSPEAREAVSQFVTNPLEGIINAADAAAIVAEVQAKTLHTIQIATKHRVPTDDIFGDGELVGDGPFGNLGDFDDSSFI